MKVKEDVTIIIMGASGDLSRRKLMPALYELFKGNYLPENFSIVAFARSDYSDEVYQKKLLEMHAYSGEKKDLFFTHVNYIQGDYDKDEDYKKLAGHLELCPPNRIFYLATPPHLVRKICSGVKRNGLSSSCANREEVESRYCPELKGWTRIIIEKPYGTDLDSALDLDDYLHSLFRERQMLRIDHYLGKETVQNMLAFRFANSLFEPVWNAHYVDRIEVNIAEDLAIEQRAQYFDQTGITRDIVQNHALQLLALVMMEPPASFDAKAIRDEKVKVLSSLVPFSSQDVSQSTLRAQYKGYKDSLSVSSQSMTETFMAIRCSVNNWRWANTPIYIRAGKALDQKTTEVHVHFKTPPYDLFKYRSHYSKSNLVMFRIQPHEGIHLLVQSKVPGHEYELAPVEMNFSYNQNFNSRLQDAYERLLFDAMNDDVSLFIRNDEVEASWRFVDSFLKVWENDLKFPMYSYQQGDMGPSEMHSFIHQWGHKWSKDICLVKI